MEYRSRPFRNKRQMCSKYPLSKNDAKSALKLAKHSKQYRKEKRMYFCEDCNAWHLTSQLRHESEKDVTLVEPERWKKLLNKEYENKI